MDFDFYTQYQKTSTLELLLILKEPAKYQQAAIDAAGRVLNERGVTEQDEKQATEHMEAQFLAKVKKKDKEKTLSELLDPLTEQTAPSQQERGIKVGLIILTLYYIWSFYQAAYYIYIDLEYGDPGIDLSIIIQWLTVVYSPFICYLLWKRHPWGWRLLFGENVLVLSSVIVTSVFGSGLDYSSLIGISLTIFFFGLRVLLCVLTWRDDVSNAFSINETDRAKTLKITLIVGAIIAAMIMISMSDVKIFS